VLCAAFLYLLFDFVTKEKLPKALSYEKRVCKMLMKLTNMEEREKLRKVEKEKRGTIKSERGGKKRVKKVKFLEKEKKEVLERGIKEIAVKERKKRT